MSKLWAKILVFSIFCHFGCESMRIENYESTTEADVEPLSRGFYSIMKPISRGYNSIMRPALIYCGPGYAACGNQCCKMVTNDDYYY